MICLYSSSVKARSVSIRTLPSELIANEAFATVSSSGASMTTAAIVLAKRQIEVLELGAEPLERLLGRVQACRAILDGLDPLLGKTREK